jgi:hypothetical protein
MRHYLKYILWSLLGLILIFFVLNFKTLWAARIIYAESLSGRDNLTKAVAALEQADFKTAGAYADEADVSFTLAVNKIEAIRKNFFVDKITSINKSAQEVEYLIKTAEVLSRSLSKGTAIAEKIGAVLEGQTTANFADWPVADRRQVLQLIYEATPDLNGLKANLNLALLNLNKVKGAGLIGPFASQIKVVKDQLQLGADLMDRSLVLSQLLPALAGYPESSNFLVVLQNSDELRPTGGFIGTLGIFQVNLGDLTSFQTNDSYHLDMPASLANDFKVEPPAPIKKYLGVNNWYLRDSNWSPDWPTSAQKIEWFYKTEAVYNSDPQIKAVPEFTGVIAITPRLVTDLLYLVGPITVNGQEYNKDNFVELLQYEVEMAYRDKGVSEWDRKKVIGEIFKELKNRLFTLSSDRYLELLNVVSQNINRKNLLVYFTDPSVQGLSRGLNWSGEVKSTANDYLMVVDANLAAFKTDQVMDKTYNYNLEAKADGLYARLKIDYQHNGQFDWKTTRYRSYVRVYVPVGAKLISSQGFTDGPETTSEQFANSEATKTVFGGFISIEPGNRGHLELEYKLPDNIFESVRGGVYSLYFQKQPGNHLKDVQIDLQFTQPFKSYSPTVGSQELSTSEIKWSTILDTDQLYEVSF